MHKSSLGLPATEVAAAPERWRPRRSATGLGVPSRCTMAPMPPRCCRSADGLPGWSTLRQSPISDWRGAGNGPCPTTGVGSPRQGEPAASWKVTSSLPAQHKPFQDLQSGPRLSVSAQQSLVCPRIRSWGYPMTKTQRMGRRGLPAAIPNRYVCEVSSTVAGSCRRYQATAAGGPVQYRDRRRVISCDWAAARPTSGGRPIWPARLTGRGRFIEGGVQTQAGDEGNGLSQGLAAVEQVAVRRSRRHPPAPGSAAGASGAVAGSSGGPSR